MGLHSIRKGMRLLGPATACVGAATLALSLFGGALASAHAGGAAPKTATATPISVAKEVLVLERSTTNRSNVVVFEEVTLKSPSKSSWIIPLPYDTVGIHPQSGGVVDQAGQYRAAAGSETASVAYTLPGTLGSVFAQNLVIPNGQLAVLAGTGVYPGVGTGLTLHGQAEVGGKTFVLFSGKTNGPTDTIHFSLTAGHPGNPWSDAVDVALVIWLALGAYAGISFLAGPLAQRRGVAPGHDAA